MTAFAMVRDLWTTDAFTAMAGGEHVSNFTRKFVAGAFVVIVVGACIFVWWLKSDRDDD